MATSSVGKFNARAKLIARYIKIGIVVVLAFSLLKAARTYKRISLPRLNNQMAPGMLGGCDMLVHTGRRSPRDFAKGEVAVYQVSTKDGIETRFGRVVAMPGDTVRIEERFYFARSSGVFVNSSQLDAGVELTTAVDANAAKVKRQKKSELVVPEEKMYLLNDNLDSQLPDSRTLGPLSRDAVMGRLVMVFGSDTTDSRGDSK